MHHNKPHKNYVATQVVWIHGANQTPNSFAYLRSTLPDWNSVFVQYNSHNGFYHNLSSILEQINLHAPTFVIAHSLGGIYALHLTQHCQLTGAVTMSTPYGGSATADWARYFLPGYQLFRDVGRRSPPIMDAHKIKITMPWTQIVSTAGGVLCHGAENDGVVTVSSMEHRANDMKIVRINATHYDVVNNQCSADIVFDSYNSRKL